jgi:NAD(P)-dependent dehydrogenase (short-subunit alcohol dehydrogenase family)
MNTAINSTPKTALIIGASRGIGFNFAKQYRADGWRVIATVRKPQDASALKELECEVHILDVTDAEGCTGLATTLNKERLDIAIINAGVYGPTGSPGAALDSPSRSEFDQVMHTNVLAAMQLLPLLGPLVATVSGKLAVISSQMGSISMRHQANGWLYRASKAALNSVLMDAAITFGKEGAICVALHPGWVRTDMGGSNADLSVTESVTDLRRTLAGLQASDNAKFLNHDGSELPW